MSGRETIQAFRTSRLSVYDWSSDLKGPETRQQMETDLVKLLTSKVLAHLPPSFQIKSPKREMSDWVSARQAESTVLRVNHLSTDSLVGLVFLSIAPADEGWRDIHIGYLLAETSWGQGYGTELLKGLVTSVSANPPVRLIGGVDRSNVASARVLEKAGFKRSAPLSGQEVDFFVLTLA